MRLNSPQINLITRACMKASRSLIRDFGELENLQVSSKGPGDFVSSADKRTERILVDELQKAHPEYGIVTEETGIINKSNITSNITDNYIDLVLNAIAKSEGKKRTPSQTTELIKLLSQTTDGDNVGQTFKSENLFVII